MKPDQAAGQFNQVAYGAQLNTYQTAAPPAPQLLSSVEQRLESSIDQAHTLVQKLSATADRLVGPQPKGVGAVEKDPQHQSTVGRLENSLSRLQTALGAAVEEAQRLDRL